MVVGSVTHGRRRADTRIIMGSSKFTLFEAGAWLRIDL